MGLIRVCTASIVWQFFPFVCLQAGLSQVHFTAERSSYYHQLTQAEEQAKSQKLKVLLLQPVSRFEIDYLFSHRANVYKFIHST